MLQAERISGHLNKDDETSQTLDRILLTCRRYPFAGVQNTSHRKMVEYQYTFIRMQYLFLRPETFTLLGQIDMIQTCRAQNVNQSRKEILLTLETERLWQYPCRTLHRWNGLLRKKPRGFGF